MKKRKKRQHTKEKQIQNTDKKKEREEMK